MRGKGHEPDILTRIEGFPGAVVRASLAEERHGICGSRLRVNLK